MKIILPLQKTVRFRQGFTLAEVMVASAIFSMVILAMVAMQIFGLRVYTLAATKLSATAGGRHTLDVMRDQIRSSKRVYVGIYDPAATPGFSRVPIGSPQTGNALQIFLTTNTAPSSAIVYYMNLTNGTVCSLNNGAVSVLANYITNYYSFELNDFSGTNIMTDYQNNPVVHVIMNFSEWEYPISYVGGNALNAYNYYTLRTKISRRSKQ